MTVSIKHALRVQTLPCSAPGHAGWRPGLSITLRGPVSRGARLEWTMRHPDRSVWFTQSASVRPCDGGHFVTLVRRHDGDCSTATGSFGVQLRLVHSESSPAVILHEGAVSIARSGEHDFVVEHDWWCDLVLVSVDFIDQPDAPRLVAGAFLKGSPPLDGLLAQCRRNGELISTAPASAVSAMPSSARDATVTEVAAEFDSVRGWNNLRDAGWGSGWHLIDEHDGVYDVCFTHRSTLVVATSFVVHDGRISPPQHSETEPALGIEEDARRGATIIFGARGPRMGTATTPPHLVYYGDPHTSARWTSMDAVMALRLA